MLGSSWQAARAKPWVIGRQVYTAYGKRIDILAINSDGTLHVIELKKDRTPRDVVAQALDYGSWVGKLGADEIAEIYASHTSNGISFAEAFRERFDADVPETINESHRLVIVASEHRTNRRVPVRLRDPDQRSLLPLLQGRGGRVHRQNVAA